MFAENLRKLRQARGLSGQALAEQANITRQAISKFEKGQATPKPETLILIADALGVTCEILIRGHIA